MLLMTTLIVFGGCMTNMKYTETNDIDTNNTNASEMSAEEKLEHLLEQLHKEQTYDEVCSILGGPGKEIGYGVILYEWEVNPCIKVNVWFKGTSKGLVVMTFKGEIIN